MAGREEEGTGKHKHKSAEEPYAHHEAPSTRNEGSEGKGHDSRSESKGHESHSESRSGGSQSGGREESRGSGESRGQSDNSDLKSREYRGPDGEIHHHTRTYEEQHKGGK